MSIAELLCLAIRKLLWCVGTVRPCCASRLGGVRGLLRALRLGERMIDDDKGLLYVIGRLR